MAQRLTIGHVSRTTGCKVQTIRYYEEIGLLPPPARSDGNQRIYEQSQIDRLVFIRHARQLGFPLDSIRELLRLADEPDQSCAAVDAIANAQLAEVERRIGRLQLLKVELERMIAQCRGDSVADCRIIEALGAPDPGV